MSSKSDWATERATYSHISSTQNRQMDSWFRYKVEDSCIKTMSKVYRIPRPSCVGSRSQPDSVLEANLTDSTNRNVTYKEWCSLKNSLGAAQRLCYIKTSLNRNSAGDFKEPLEIKAARSNLQLRKLIKVGNITILSWITFQFLKCHCNQRNNLHTYSRSPPFPCSGQRM